MKTKIVYVLVSSHEDLFWEQCLISVMSVKYQMPNAYTVLVCDTDTDNSIKNGIRKEITSFFSEIINIPFDINVNKTKRSRILKVTLREIIKGDYLYIDCDTLITQPLSEIDGIPYAISAVLDGHCLFKYHPMREYFISQNILLNYDLDRIVKYYSGGVMYVKDIDEAHLFYKQWKKNYLESCEKGILFDEPALSKTIIEHEDILHELDGTWNCQIRFGSLFLASNKILHFCSKKNMPVSVLSNKEFLRKIQANGINTPGLIEYISNWKCSMPRCMVTCIGEDASFAVSPFYEIQRKRYINQNTINNIHLPKFGFWETVKRIRNKSLGSISPKTLSSILYTESFHNKMNTVSDNDFNKMLHKLAFYSDISEWAELADKLAVREYIKRKGLSEILPDVYAIWEESDNINTAALPLRYVLKCNHDNGSAIVVYDNLSVDSSFVKKYYKKKLHKCFGIETAEPHYKNIPHKIYAEEYLENDKPFSDSLVSYKFFSFYGKSEYCQVIYDSQHHKNQKAVIYKVSNWEKQCGYILNNEGNVGVPCPNTIDNMLRIIDLLSSHLPFCRVDLYEIRDHVYFSEMTFMPGAGRIKGFSQEFLFILGHELNKTKHLWIQ